MYENKTLVFILVPGGGDALERSFGAGVPLSPSNPEPVENKVILSFRFPVFVTQSPIQLFPLS